MEEILSADATGQLAALASRQVSAAALLALALKRCEVANPPINAVVAQNVERATAAARAVDEGRAKGEPLGPLAGLPMTVKDTFDVDGLPASSGLDAYRRHNRPDAVVVARARAAGAVIWGKTNTPVLAGDFQTYNPLYGTTNNPWDPARTCGGSSGGAASALAARITALEIGSDIGGSLRTPANFCGVYSHKPTWGLVPQIGHIPPAPGSAAERDLNVVGPMARSARDLRLLLSVLSNGAVAPTAPAAELRGLRVGLWLDEPDFPLDPEVRGPLEALGAALAQQGAEVTPVSRPVDMAALFPAYRALLGGVLAQDLPPRTLAQMRRMRPLAELALKFGVGENGWATLTLGYTLSHLDWMAADEVRAKAAAAIEGQFERFDAILAPINPVAAFPHDHRPFAARTLALSTGQTIPYLSMLCWIALATACRLPATVVPVARTANGLPVGAQIIGPRGGDARTLAIAAALDAAGLTAFVAPPERTPAAARAP